MEKITFDILTIEVTRRCNMSCPHCLRGEAQQVDIDRKHIDNLLSQTQMIGKLVITGGEPSLVPEIIEYIAESLINRGIPLLNFEIYTNGLIYNDQFTGAVKRFREIIDISCEYGLTKKEATVLSTSRCYVGVSLDRYHAEHCICESHYEQYKKELYGKADVLKIMRGNAPLRAGRAMCLSDTTYDKSALEKYDALRRVEVLDKDHVPICRIYDRFRLLNEKQKVVCCNVYLGADGCVRHGSVVGRSYEEMDAFPKICMSSDNIWFAILSYNEGRKPCAEIEGNLLQQGISNPQTMRTAVNFNVASNTEDAQDELSEKQKYEVLESIVRAVKNGAKNNLQIRSFQYGEIAQNATTNWKDIAKKSAKHFREPLHNDKPDHPQMQAAKWEDESKKELRCKYCGKVVQYEGRNIHCTTAGGGLKCEYCGHITAKGGVA